MSASYRRFQSLVYTQGSRVTQKSMISQFNAGGCRRGERRRGRGYGGRGYGCDHSCGCGGLWGRGWRSYGHNPYGFARRYGTFMSEAQVYPVDKWRLLFSQQNNNIQEMKIREGWRGFDVPPDCYKRDNEVKPVVEQSFAYNLNNWWNDT